MTDGDDDAFELTLEFEMPVTPGDLEREFTRLLESLQDRGEIDAGFDVRHVPVSGSPRKVSYEPRVDGNWDRLEKEWREGGWSAVGHEIVEDISIETIAGVIGPGQ